VGARCNCLHLSRCKDSPPDPSQEWSLVRFSPSILPARSLSSPDGLPRFTESLTRRRFALQNVESGGYIGIDRLRDQKDEANVVIEPSRNNASYWHFQHTVNCNWHSYSMQDISRYEDMFALVTGSAPEWATLDHWGARRIVVSHTRFWPTNDFHKWKVIPRNGVFCFQSVISSRLLCQSPRNELVDTAPATAFADLACQWRLIDATIGEPFPIVYDSTLWIPPHELGLTGDAPLNTDPHVVSVGWTEVASAAMCHQFLDGLKREHDLVREMLKNGYKSLVILPQVVRGWRDTGGVYSITLQDEETILGLPKYRGKRHYVCEKAQE
jgi:hypothetical protein